MGSNFLSPALAGYCCSREGTDIARQKQHIMASRIRQNYKEDCEALVNKQINMELYASYVYMSIAYYGFSSFFKKNSDEERDHAEKFIKYQNRRGGKVVFQDIASRPLWSGALLWRPWRLPLSWRRRSIKVFSTCTRQLTLTPISAISWRPTSWTSRWTPSRRSRAGSPS